MPTIDELRQQIEDETNREAQQLLAGLDWDTFTLPTRPKSEPEEKYLPGQLELFE
jgi:hypothetical protein